MNGIKSPIREKFNHNIINDIESLIKSISKTINPKKIYSLIQIRKIIKNLRYNLSGKYTSISVKKISSFLNNSLPDKCYTDGKVIGQIIIDHLENDLKEKIYDTLSVVKILQSETKPIKSIVNRAISYHKSIEIKNNLSGKNSNSQIPIASVIPGSNTKIIKCAITETFQEVKNINHKYVILQPFASLPHNNAVLTYHGKLLQDLVYSFLSHIFDFSKCYIFFHQYKPWLI